MARVDQSDFGRAQSSRSKQAFGQPPPGVGKPVSRPANVARDEFGQGGQPTRGVVLDARSPTRASAQLLSVASYIPGTKVMATLKEVELDSAGQPKFIRPGRPMLVEKRVPATLEGHDSFGRPFVTLEDGARRRLRWDKLQPRETTGFPTLAGKAEVRKLLLRGVPPENLSPAPEQLLKAIAAGLQREVIAGKTRGQDYVDALLAKGYWVLFVGGAIRDVFFLLAQNPNASAQELAAFTKDLDLVTNALPQEVRRICQALTPDLPNGGIWTPRSVDRFGVVGVGERHQGADLATLRVGLAPSQAGSVLGKTVVDDADGRDFTMNQIYLFERLIIDASGHGIADAKARLLRANEKNFLANDMLSLRYIKFRPRSFTGVPSTITLMRQHAETVFPTLQAENRFDNNFLRIVPRDCQDEQDVRDYADGLKAVMKEDGLEDLYSRWIAPRLPAIAAELQKRHSNAPVAGNSRS